MIQFRKIKTREYLFTKANPQSRSFLAFWYCRYIKDRKEVYQQIDNSKWACHYCRYIKDRPDVKNMITNQFWLNHYLFTQRPYIP